MWSRCSLHCPVCRQEFDWMTGYGREIRCCSKDCHDEAEWRRTLAILGKEYRPRPEMLVIAIKVPDESTLLATFKDKNKIADELIAKMTTPPPSDIHEGLPGNENS